MSKKSIGEQMQDFASSKWKPEGEDIVSIGQRLAEQREAPAVEALEAKLVTLRKQLDKTKGAAERVQLLDQIQQVEHQINVASAEAE